MPIVFNVAIKPTPSIFKQQDTIDVSKGENTVLSLKGRHDPCILHRARIVVDCMCAFVLLDAWISKAGLEAFMEDPYAC